LYRAKVLIVHIASYYEARIQVASVARD